MEDTGDANAKVLRVRALLKRGGKTPTINTIVRTENVVATSSDLRSLTATAATHHKQLAELYEDNNQRGVIHAVGAVRSAVGESYGLTKEARAVPSVDAPSGVSALAPEYAVDACGKMIVHTTRLAALCRSFATEHRREANAENDVGHAICDTATHLHEAYAQIDDEVFSKGEHSEQSEIAARLINRRARQLAARAKLDAHGEVFDSVEFAAAYMSLLRASATFNTLHLNNSLYTNICAPIELPEFVPSHIAADSHLLLAEVLRQEGLKESTVTNTLARASRHAEAAESILDVDDAKDPLDDTHVSSHAGQPLQLDEWAAEAMRTGVAQFDVIGGFSMSLDGNLTTHVDSLAECEWLCLRARVTTPLAAALNPDEIARVACTAAWRRMRYDAGTYDAPFFRPTEEQLRAASRIGIALCGRGNLTSSASWWHDADVLVVDMGIAPERLGMVVVGNHAPARATLHNAEDAVGYMFSSDELAAAQDAVEALPRVGQRKFLCELQVAEPASWVESAQREEELPAEVSHVVALPLDTVPELTISAHEAFERAINATAALKPAYLVKETNADVEATSSALRAALCISISESPRALDDLASKITRTAQPASTEDMQPSVALYQQLNHQGERAVDVAASIVGLRDLEPLAAELELEQEEEEGALDAAFEDALVGTAEVVGSVESGTPSSEDFEELA